MGQDGDTFIADRIEARDIEIIGNIKERDKSAQKLRCQNLTRILNPHYSAILVYEYGNHKRIISCKVETVNPNNTAPIFDQFIIQLNCSNPFWREERENREDIAAWLGGFEFPEPDGLYIDMDEGWEIGYREPSLIKNVVNNGDVRSGLRVDFRAIGNGITVPEILNVNTGEYIKFISQFVMQAGDTLTVNTGYGQKDVKLNRSGIITDAFRFLDIDSTYIQLEVGDNLFRYDAATNLESLEVSIYHNNLFLGV
jgi:phage-related protein